MQENSLQQGGIGHLDSALATNKVLRNTYLLLSMTLLFSAVAAGVAIAMNIGRGTALIMTLAAFALLFVVNRTADSEKGIYAIFAFTGLLGASLGPMLSFYLAMPGGPALVKIGRAHV